MRMQKHRQFYQQAEKQQYYNIGRGFLSEDANHGYGLCWFGLVKINFSKANIISIQTRDDHLVRTHLLAILSHKLKSLIKVFQSWVTVYLSSRSHCVIIQQIDPSFFHVKQKSEERRVGKECKSR